MKQALITSLMNFILERESKVSSAPSSPCRSELPKKDCCVDRRIPSVSFFAFGKVASAASLWMYKRRPGSGVWNRPRRVKDCLWSIWKKVDRFLEQWCPC
jgi:hypothetical protein